jgi:Raf kinase inhibitor-like YbhB/YbcL family protein
VQRIILLLSLVIFTLTAEAATDFVIESADFKEKDTLRAVYTCDGLDISPELHWTNIPQKTQSLALIMSDSDAPLGTFYHWVVYNIPPNTNSFAEAVKEMPPGTQLGKNSWNNAQYNGPCPPKGSLHHYIFTLYAIDKNLSLPANSDAKTLINSLKDSIIKQTQLTGVYTRL